MKAEVTLGKVKLIIEEAKEMEVLHKAFVLANAPKTCDVCGKPAIALDSNKDKDGHIYCNVVCSCGAKAKLGQYLAGGYFWHKFEVYVPKTAGQAPAPAPSDDIPPPVDDGAEAPF